MPDLDMALPTRPEVGLHPERKMSIKNRKWKPEVEINFERNELAMRFQRLPHIFDPAQLRHGTGYTA